MESSKKITSFPQGRITVPPSKSVAHRSLICAALSGGDVTIKNLDLSQDIKATLRCITALGGTYTYKDRTLCMSRGISKPLGSVQLDCGESGSTLRFFIPIAVAMSEDVEFIGAERLFKRPLSPYSEVFLNNGVTIIETAGGIKTSGRLKAGTFSLIGNVSSQFVTGLLFALPLLEGKSEILMTTKIEGEGYVDLTLAEMCAFGVKVENNEYKSFEIPNGAAYTPIKRTVEGDYSNAAFFLASAALGCDITVAGLSEASLQGDKAFLDILKKVGADVKCLDNGDIKVTATNTLTAIDIDVSEIPDLVPPLAVLLCFCKGVSRITGASRLRIKESDRLKTVTGELNKLGARVTEQEDSLLIHGVERLAGGSCLSHNDHRIAMMCAVAGIKSEQPVEIIGFDCVAKSYPMFWNDFCKKERGE